METAIAKTFGKMYGLPCWGVKPGLFPSLMLKFGNPRIEVSPPRVWKPRWFRGPRQHLARRQVIIRGEWFLWIYYCH